MRQVGTGQTEQVTHRLAIRYTVRMVHRQNRLIVRSREQIAHIRQYGNDRESQQQNSQHHTRFAGLEELFDGLPPTWILDANSPFGSSVRKCISGFICSSRHNNTIWLQRYNK